MFKLPNTIIIFNPLVGEYNGKHYPDSYNYDEKILLRRYISDLKSRYILEYNGYSSKGKQCRAGHSYFSMYLESGHFKPCKAMSHNVLFNYLESTPEDFLNRFDKSLTSKCPVNLCRCEFTVEQEEFLKEHNIYNMNNYDSWVTISASDNNAYKNLKKEEINFVEELIKRLRGNNIYVWGAGIDTSRLLDLLFKNGFPADYISGIIDSNPQKSGYSIKGIQCIYKENFINSKAEECTDIIISSAAFESEIYEEIINNKQINSNIMRLYHSDLKVPF